MTLCDSHKKYVRFAQVAHNLHKIRCVPPLITPYKVLYYNIIIHLLCIYCLIELYFFSLSM